MQTTIPPVDFHRHIPAIDMLTRLSDDDGMVNYLLRDIDPALWAKVKARATKDGHTLRVVLMRLLAHYVRHGLK